LRTVTERKPVRAPLFSFFLPLTLAFLVPSFQSIFPISSFVISLSLSYGYMSCYVIEDVFCFCPVHFLTRVTDPHHFNADPDTAFHFNADPDPAPIKVLGIFGH
jgi:hypothetical protein